MARSKDSKENKDLEADKGEEGNEATESPESHETPPEEASDVTETEVAEGETDVAADAETVEGGDETPPSDADATPDTEAETIEDAEVVAETPPENVEPESAETAEAETPDATPEETPSEEPKAPEPAPAQAKARGGFVPMLLGGIAAGVVGFLAGQYTDIFAAPPPEGPTSQDNAALIEAQAARIEELQASLEDIASRDVAGEIGAAVAPVDAKIDSGLQSATERLETLQGDLGVVTSNLGALTEQVGPLEFGGVLEQFDTISSDLEGLTEKVEVLTLRPIATGMDVDAFDTALSQFRTDLRGALDQAQAEIEDARQAAARISEEAIRVEQAALSDFRGSLQEAVDEVQAEIDQARETAAKISEEAFAAEAEAQRAEQSAIAVSSVSAIAAALEDGSSYTDALAEAQSVLDVEIPAVIAENAETGVASIGTLQENFPDAARAAINSAVRADTGEGAMDRLTAFIRVQSGARSLAPREGDDPDAVLSRAEAALRSGDVAGAVAEVDGLPEAGQAAMADWRSAAATRVEALAAAADLAQQLQTN